MLLHLKLGCLTIGEQLTKTLASLGKPLKQAQSTLPFNMKSSREDWVLLNFLHGQGRNTASQKSYFTAEETTVLTVLLHWELNTYVHTHQLAAIPSGPCECGPLFPFGLFSVGLISHMKW